MLMTLPLKWKLYRIFNYLIFISSLIVLALIIIAWNARPPGASDRLFIYLLFLLFLLMAFYCIGNLILMSRNFPDKILYGYKKVFNIISITGNIISVIGLAIFIITGFISESEVDVNSNDYTGEIILAVLLLLWIADAFILICQFQVVGFLKKNNTRSHELMIESIGTD